MATKKKATKKAEAKPKVEKVVQNGIAQPREGTVSARIWQIADYYRQESGTNDAKRSDVVGSATEEGINASTASTQFGRWRKFNGLQGTGGSATPAKEDAA